MITVSAHVLRVVHRRIGVKHQLALGFTVVGIERDTNAKGYHQFIGIQIEWAIDSANQRVGQRGRIIRTFSFCQQNKLITTDTGKGELTLQGREQALRHGDKQSVTDIMAVRIVDGFKPVEIHEHQCKMGAFTVSFADGLIESVLQQNTVRQTRQRILQSQLSEFAVRFCKG